MKRGGVGLSSYSVRPCSLYIQPPFPCHTFHFLVFSLSHSRIGKLKSRNLENQSCYWICSHLKGGSGEIILKLLVYVSLCVSTKLGVMDKKFI